jgi:hypothetical protein
MQGIIYHRDLGRFANKPSRPVEPGAACGNRKLLERLRQISAFGRNGVSSNASDKLRRLTLLQ